MIFDKTRYSAYENREYPIMHRQWRSVVAGDRTKGLLEIRIIRTGSYKSCPFYPDPLFLTFHIVSKIV